MSYDEYTEKERIFAASQTIHQKGLGNAPMRTDVSPIEEIRIKIMETAERLHFMRQRMADYNERLFGPVPEPAIIRDPSAHGRPEPVPMMGSLAEVRDSLEHLARQSEYLSAQIERACTFA